MNNVFYDFNKRELKLEIVFSLITMALIYGCSDDDNVVDITPPTFLITPISIDQLTSFISFGEDLSSSQKNPAIEYYTDHTDVVVRSVSDGIIKDIRANLNIDDQEVWIKPSANSQWLIIYDHILNVDLTIGDQISAGEIIGTIGIGNRTELQINDAQNIAHCPLQFGSQNFIQQHTSFSDNWCLVETVIP